MHVDFLFCIEGLPDLLMLGDFNEGPLLHTVRERYSKEQIYTSIGSAILLSVNPYQRLNIFNTTIAQKYRKIIADQRKGINNGQADPHLFLVAEDSF